MDGNGAGIVEGPDLRQFQPGCAGLARAGGLHGQLFGPDHGPGHRVRRQFGHLSGAGKLAAPEYRDVVGKGHDLAELMRDHEDGQFAPDNHVAQHAEDLVGLRRRQYRGRFVEDQEATFQIELLEDLAFLPFAGRNVGDLGAERDLERHPGQERVQLLHLLRPVHHGRDVVARQHEILGDRHRRHQREVLVDHAEAERVGVLRIGDGLLAASDQDVALGGAVIAHDALDQRRLAGAVLAEQRMEGAWSDLQRDIVEREKIAKAHRHGDGIEAEGARGRRRFADDHEIAPISASEVATAPNTPPCILIIFSA